jgi:hypothetical protein
MAREKLPQLPLYPGERECRAPSAERILETSAPLQRHRLRDQGQLVQTFEPELTDLQQQILTLMRLPASIFRATAG